MQAFYDFIHAKDLEQNETFKLLKCDIFEGQILQAMAQGILKDELEFCVHELLSRLFKAPRNVPQDFHNLTLLPHIQNLLLLGWITQNSFLQSLSTPSPLLELYNEHICLSHSFLKLLEEGIHNDEILEITPYNDHLEYLKDCFFHIDLLCKISSLRQNKESQSPVLSRATHQLKTFEESMNARLKLTKKELEIIKFFKEYQLDSKEQILFCALLKEEYSLGDENLRELNKLLELISVDEYDKLKHRALLDETSKLVQKGLVDYDELLNPFGGSITRTFFIPEEILGRIIHPNKKKKSLKVSLEAMIKEQEIFESITPKQGLDEIILHKDTREILDNLLAQVDSKVMTLLQHWGVKDKKRGIDAKILLYGAPGTGKTLTALALAKSLKKPILSFDCSKILSMYVGESEKNVRKIFDSFEEMRKSVKNEPILLLDEADQFLSTRGSSGNSADKMHNQMQNIFLEQIERFSGILIATTNLLESFDSAFSRRFNYKIEFKRPNLEQKEALWLKHLPKNAEFEGVSKKALAKILARYDLSGGQIALVVKNTAYKVATKVLEGKKPIFTQDDFITHIKAELSGNFDGTKSMGFGV